MNLTRFLFAAAMAVSFAGATIAAESDDATTAAEPATPPVKPGKIVHIRLAGPLTEVAAEDPFGFGGAGAGTSLRALLAKLAKARKDDTVKAVVVTVGDFQPGGVAQVDELRRAFIELRGAKPVLVHLAAQVNELNTVRYALLAAGTELSLEPTSDVWMTGFYVEQPYLKDMLGKLGVEFDVVAMGDYKSAGETLSRSAPSKAAEENTNWLLDGMFATVTDMVAGSRKMTREKASAALDGGPYSGDDAVKAGLIDRVEHRDEFLARVKAKFPGAKVDNTYGDKAKPKVDLESPFAIFQLLAETGAPPKRTGKDAVGIVHVDGMIVGGHAEPGPFGEGMGTAYGDDIRLALEKAAADKTVKAIVLRVDSPGGSALASEVILRAASRAHAKKPLVVSMGNTAASGGYYVAMDSDAIFAGEATITASIGVLSGKPVTKALWNKVGANWVPYKRGKNGDLLASARPFDDAQRKQMTAWMEKIYGTFKGHVTDSRGAKLKKPIDQLAGGRVYTGKQAKEMGLIDEIGGLEAAIADAARRAKLDEGYEVRVVPEPKNAIQQLVEEFGGKGGRKGDLDLNATGASAGSGFGPGGSRAGAAADLMKLAAPMLSALDPARTKAAVSALARVELFRREPVLMVTPSDLVFP